MERWRKLSLHFKHYYSTYFGVIWNKKKQKRLYWEKFLTGPCINPDSLTSGLLAFRQRAGKLAPLGFIQTTAFIGHLLRHSRCTGRAPRSAGGDRGRLYRKRGHGMVVGPSTEEERKVWILLEYSQVHWMNGKQRVVCSRKSHVIGFGGHKCPKQDLVEIRPQCLVFDALLSRAAHSYHKPHEALTLLGLIPQFHWENTFFFSFRQERATEKRCRVMS